ncbi:MAG: hypothetical protein ACI9DC_005230 [Gammaproteobacteria bacterium]|jgi:hypothetical protein
MKSRNVTDAIVLIELGEDRGPVARTDFKTLFIYK